MADWPPSRAGELLAAVDAVLSPADDGGGAGEGVRAVRRRARGVVVRLDARGGGVGWACRPYRAQTKDQASHCTSLVMFDASCG